MIDVINLRKSFGDLEILKGINITINKGDIVAVLGPSGSGKSTFLRCLNCMEDPTSGSIVFKGVDIADMKSISTCIAAIWVWYFNILICSIIKQFFKT